ncbi:MAG: hypothetical protein J5854_00150 [Clostridia bacterium]|nr:hypothetical protein [Clostridia bacterium]
MKKAVSLVIVLVLLALALSACRADPAGRYVTVSVNGSSPFDYLKGKGDAADALLLLEAMGLTEEDFNTRLFVAELFTDGTVRIESILGMGGTGTWTKSGSTVTVIAGSETYEFTLNGNRLSGKVGQADFVLEKQK